MVSRTPESSAGMTATSTRRVAPAGIRPGTFAVTAFQPSGTRRETVVSVRAELPAVTSTRTVPGVPAPAS